MAATRNDPLKPSSLPSVRTPGSAPELQTPVTAPIPSTAALSTFATLPIPSFNLSSGTGAAGDSSPPGTFRIGAMASTTNPTAFLAGRLTQSGTPGDIVSQGDQAFADMVSGLNSPPSLGDLAAMGVDLGSPNLSTSPMDPSVSSAMTGMDLGTTDGSDTSSMFSWQNPQYPTTVTDDMKNMWDDEDDGDDS